MKHTIQFKAHGHPNIRSTHKTTLMTTTEPHLTPRGDCIIAVGAETGLAQLPDEIKEAAHDPETEITFTISINHHVFTARGKGHPNLTYTDPIDMVARKSSYTCGRTLMIASDKAASDIPVEIIKALQNPEAVITVQLTYEKPEK
jgi:uncharacterized protein